MSGPQDTVRRGPQRWERAALNAMRHPNSAGARLYHARVRNASWIRDGLLEGGGIDRPYEFTGPVYDTLALIYVDTREYVTCSTFCAVMQVQIVHATTDLEEIDRVFKGTPSACHMTMRKVRPLTGKHRKMRCQVCAGEVR